MNKKLITLSLALGLIIGCSGEAENKTAEIALNTIQCGMCTDKIASGLGKLEGVVKIDVDLEKKIGKVVYKAGVINLGVIEKAIAAIGYDANNTPAEPKAYSELDMCCKVPGK
jgi:copper chaperone CopZ|tara:strand:+ start:759 stop:1097 length:339 start_codon:yes stop_codon:yes gene_type:complete